MKAAMSLAFVLVAVLFSTTNSSSVQKREGAESRTRPDKFWLVESKGVDLCFLCEKIVDFLIKEIDDINVDENLELLIADICPFLPIDDCQDTLISSLIIIKYLFGSMDGKTLCTEAGVCS